MGKGLPGSLVRGRSVREILDGADSKGADDADADADGDGDDEGDGDGAAEEDRKVKKRERRGRNQTEGGAAGDGRTWFQLRPEIPGSELVDWEDLAEILGDEEEEGVPSNAQVEHGQEQSIATSTSSHLPTASEAETDDGMDVEQTQLPDVPPLGPETHPPVPSASASTPLALSRQQTLLPISASFRQAKTEYKHKHPNPNAPFSISTKEVVLKRLFPKYEPYLEGLPAGRIYLRHEVDRFEFRALEGWGCESYSTETTDDGKGRGKAKGKEKGRLLQWSFTRGTWMFVMDELPSKERPHKMGGYRIPDRGDVLGLGTGAKIRKEGRPTMSFLAQGQVVVPKDSEMVVRQFPECAVPPSAAEDKDENEDTVQSREVKVNEDEREERPLVKTWEWVMPVKESLWVPPMHEIVRKFGEGARPVWDLGGRMLWDVVRGQWMFVVCDALGEMEELVDRPPVVREGKDEVMRAVDEGATPIGKARQIYDVCVGGRARVEWDAFHRAREYLVSPSCLPFRSPLMELS